MKKIVLVLSASLISLVTINAQTIAFGVKGGVNANNLPLKTEAGTSDDIVLDGGTTGFHVGGVVDLAFNSHFSIQPNLLFAMKGGGFFTEGKINIMAIDLPINFLYKHDGFFVGAGPNFSYGISGKLKPYDSAEEDVDLYEKPDPTTEEPFKRFEIGANVLMGYQFPSGLTIGASYTPGISNLLNDEDGTIGANTKINTRMFGFSIGYMFKK